MRCFGIAAARLSALCALAALTVLRPAAADAPKIDLRPALGGALTQGAWQPITSEGLGKPETQKDGGLTEGNVRVRLLRSQRALRDQARSMRLCGLI